MKNVTKKVLAEAERLTKEFGYWSDEVRDYIGQLGNYTQQEKVHNFLSKYR